MLEEENENTYLDAIRVSSNGRLVAVGRHYDEQFGGAHKDLLIYEKAGPNDIWVEIPVPHLGSEPRIYQELNGVDFITGHPDNDFVAVGEYQPDVFNALPSNGVLLRYHRATNTWTVRDLIVPGSEAVHIHDIVVDAQDGERFIIVGLYRPFGSEYRPLVVEYRSDIDQLTFLPTPPLSPFYQHELYSVTARPGGGFVASGTSWFSGGFIQGKPLFLEVAADGTVTQLPGPTTVPAFNQSYIYDAVVRPDGRVLAVGAYIDLVNVNLTFCWATEYEPTNGQWTLLSPLNPGELLPNGGRSNQFFAVDLASDGTITAVGRLQRYDTVAQGYFYGALAQRFDGSVWTVEDLPLTFTVDPNLAPSVDGFGPQLFDVAVHPSGQRFGAGWFQSKAGYTFFNTALVLKDR